MIAVTRRAWLVVIAVLVVAVGVVVGVVVASSGSDGTPAAAGGSRHPSGSPTTSAAPLPSICPAVATSLIARQLQVSVARAVSTSTQFARTCQWRNSAGDALLTVTTDPQPELLLLHTLGNNGAVKVGHVGGTAVFAPRPPRLAVNARGTGALVTIAPGGYRSLLPAGTTNPARIPRTKVVAPLTAIGTSVVQYLSR
jgi:preprotein translocase subunit SecG